MATRWPVRPVGYALVLASCLPLSPAAAPAADEAHTPLTSATRRPSFVFASTPDGLFRASLQAKRWERLKTPPGMPANGTFAALPEKSTLVLYLASPPTPGLETQARPDDRYGLYVSRDDGANWELVSERKDLGPALLLPDGGLFAIAGRPDPINYGNHLLRSTDLGKTWRDISGDLQANLVGLEPDPDHPGLVRIDAWAIRSYTIVADDANYRWRTIRGSVGTAGRRPSAEFFSRDSSSTNRYYVYQATLANYFGYDFGNATSVHALEVVPLKERFEFAAGARVVVPIRVVFHADLERAKERKPAAEGRSAMAPATTTEKFADQPGGADFWGIRVETPEVQVAKYPTRHDVVTTSVETTPVGETRTSTSQPPRVAYQVFDLGPSRPYERDLDLGRLYDFSKPGEYRVQLIYSSGGNPDNDRGEWDGSFTSPVFTVVIRK